MNHLHFAEYYKRTVNNYTTGKQLLNLTQNWNPRFNGLRRLLIRSSRHMAAINRLVWHVVSDAFIELVLLVGYFLTLYLMSQGKDITIGMFEKGSLYSWVRFIYTTLAICHYSVCMWIIPAGIFAWRDNVRRRNIEAGKGNSFETHYFFIHRFLAMLPFWGMAFIVHHSELGRMIILVLIGIFGFLCLLKPVERIRIFCFVLLVLLWAYAFSAYLGWFGWSYSYFGGKFIFSISLLLMAYEFYCLYYRHDVSLLNKCEKRGNPFNIFKRNSQLYTFVFGSNLAIMWILFSVVDYRGIAPESILLFLFAFYVFMVDLVFYLFRVSIFFRLLATLVVIGFFINLNYKGGFNYRAYEIDYLESNQRYQPLSLEAHLDAFTQKLARLYPDTSIHRPLILVSGEGGGSRAGLWFSQVMMDIDRQSGNRMKDLVFSMSTVSGSTIGAEAMLAYWQYQDSLNGVDPQSYPADVFKNNFISGGIFSLLTKDWWAFLRIIEANNFDRNSILQEQEAYAIHNSLYCLRHPGACGTRNVIKPRSKTNRGEIDFCMKDFMSLYYDDHGRIKAELPLLFSNTCRSGDGKRGILSPVRLDSNYIEALDVSRYIYTPFTDSLGKLPGLGANITLAAACNLSELFPFFSAPAYVGDLGFFVDGGYHENSGLKTTAELYNQIKIYLKNKKLDSIYDIYIFYLKNGSEDKELYNDYFKLSVPFFQPLSALTTVPFSGHTSYFESSFKQTISKEGDHYIPLFLNYKKFHAANCAIYEGKACTCMEGDVFEDLLITRGDARRRDSSFNFPLARFLSTTVVSRIVMNASDTLAKDVKVRRLVEHVRRLR